MRGDRYKGKMEMRPCHGFDLDLLWSVEFKEFLSEKSLENFKCLPSGEITNVSLPMSILKVEIC